MSTAAPIIESIDGVEWSILHNTVDGTWRAVEIDDRPRRFCSCGAYRTLEELRADLADGWYEEDDDE